MKRLCRVIAAPLVIAAFSAILVVFPGRMDETASNFANSPIRPTMTGSEPTASPFVSPLGTPTPITAFERPYYGPPTSQPLMPTSTPRPSVMSDIGGLSPQAYLPIAHQSEVPFTCEYGKKGVGDSWQAWGPGHSGTRMEALEYDWYYDWYNTYLPERSDDPKYVRMVFCDETSWVDREGVSRTISEVAHSDFVTERRGRVWLVFNEPDDIDSRPNVNPCGDVYFNDPVGAANHYLQVYDMIKENDPYARVFVGGFLYLGSNETRQWWNTFVFTLRNAGAIAKLEGMHVHLYPALSTSRVHEGTGGCSTADCAADLANIANEWFSVQETLGLGQLPIWISETGWLHDCSKSKEWIRDNFMRPWSQWFAKDSLWPYTVPTNPGYDSIAWYVTHHEGWFPCTHLLNQEGFDGIPTALGAYWNSFNPQ